MVVDNGFRDIMPLENTRVARVQLGASCSELVSLANEHGPRHHSFALRSGNSGILLAPKLEYGIVK